MRDTKQFLDKRRLRKAVYLGQGMHPALCMHWNLTVYFKANYSRGIAWVYGNFFCVEEISLRYLQENFHITLVTDFGEIAKINQEVKELRNKQNGTSKKDVTKSKIKGKLKPRCKITKSKFRCS